MTGRRVVTGQGVIGRDCARCGLPAVGELAIRPAQVPDGQPPRSGDGQAHEPSGVRARRNRRPGLRHARSTSNNFRSTSQTAGAGPATWPSTRPRAPNEPAACCTASTAMRSTTSWGPITTAATSPPPFDLDDRVSEVMALPLALLGARAESARPPAPADLRHAPHVRDMEPGRRHEHPSRCRDGSARACR